MGQTNSLIDDTLLDSRDGLVQLVEFVSDFRNRLDRVVLSMLLVMLDEYLFASNNVCE